MKYLKRFNESITKEEYDRILDKISDHGVKSLTSDEKSKLDNFDGKFSKDRENDVIITTDHGTWTSNDINPKYLDEKDKGSVYDDSQRKPTPKVPTPKKPTPKIPEMIYVYITKNWNNGNGFTTLFRDDQVIVICEKKVTNNCYTYYIIFKKVVSNSNCKVLKLIYNLNTTRNIRVIDDNFKVFDNYNSLLNFNLLEDTLNKCDITYSTFNNAWYYIEEDFNR
jgi:hypothetical protein